MKKITVFLVAQLPFWAVLIGLQAVSTTASAQTQPAPKPGKAVVKSGKVSNATKAAVKGEAAETTETPVKQTAPKVVKAGVVTKGTKEALKGEVKKPANEAGKGTKEVETKAAATKAEN